MVIIDTEFLFGLSENDPKHSKIQKILEKSSKDLKVPALTIFEYILVLLSKNRSNETIIEALLIIEDIFKESDMKILELEIKQIINGLKLHSAYQFGLFDCLIAGTAIASKELLIGDDTIFQKIRELEWKNYSSYINFLEER